MQQYGRFDIPVNLWQNTDKMEMHSWTSNKWSQGNLHMQKRKNAVRMQVINCFSHFNHSEDSF